MWDANKARKVTTNAVNSRNAAMESFFKEYTEEPLQKSIEVAATMGQNEIDYDVYKSPFENIKSFTIMDYLDFLAKKLETSGYVISNNFRFYQNFVTIAISW